MTPLVRNAIYTLDHPDMRVGVWLHTIVPPDGSRLLAGPIGDELVLVLADRRRRIIGFVPPEVECTIAERTTTPWKHDIPAVRQNLDLLTVLQRVHADLDRTDRTWRTP